MGHYSSRQFERYGMRQCHAVLQALEIEGGEMKSQNQSIDACTRRNFLKGTGLLAAGAASIALAGCAPSTQGGGSEGLATTGDISWDYEADIIAVGGGGAGLSCAIEGTEMGQSVIVVESQNVTGGASAINNGGIAMPGTPLQREQGIEDSPELFAKDLIELTKEDNNPEWLTMHAQLAEGLWDWLTGMGLEFKAESLLATQSASLPREHRINPGLVVDALNKRAEEDGVEVLLNTKAVELIQDENKRVIGVRCEGKNSKNVYLKANKGVVLATCGYSRNPDMLNEYIFGVGAENIPVFAAPGDEGLGHQMAMAVGAATKHMSVIGINAGQHPDGSMGQGCSLMNMGAIMVNQEGDRFVDESHGYANLWEDIAGQTGGICYQIWDDDLAQQQAENDSLLYSVAKLRDTGLLVECDTLEELAAQCNIPADELKKTVEKYNADVTSTGVDSEYGRKTLVSTHGTPIPCAKAPFYAWKTGMAIFGTSGGIRHNLNMQVERWDGSVVPGLYVAGSICTYANQGLVPGTHRNNGASGTGFGGALIWGRKVAQLIDELETGAEV